MRNKLIPKTEAEIAAEISRLETMKPKIRKFTAFGDDNHRKIDIAITVLKKDLDEDEINDRYDDSDENSEAYGVRQWMDGEDGEYGSPADQWESLVID